MINRAVSMIGRDMEKFQLRLVFFVFGEGRKGGCDEGDEGRREGMYSQRNGKLMIVR